jgi:hypothetical protein
MTCTAISAVIPRTRTVVVGQVASVTAHVRPWKRVDVILGDGTGTITLRFLGRTEIPGMSEGRTVRAEGTAGLERQLLTMLNPVYELTPTRTR